LTSTLLIAISAYMLSQGSKAVSADPLSLLACARAEAERNFHAFTDLQCDMISYRKVWQLDGTLDKDNVLVKKLYFKSPDKKKEVFVSGTMNGKPADKNDFLWERFGMDSTVAFFDIECLRPEMQGYFEIAEEGTSTVGGKRMRVLSFKSKDTDKTEMIQGRIVLPPDSCMVNRIEGRMVHKFIQSNEVNFTATFERVTPNVWLPREVKIHGEIKLGPMKRKIFSRNIFSNCRLNTGLDDEIFK